MEFKCIYKSLIGIYLFNCYFERDGGLKCEVLVILFFHLYREILYDLDLKRTNSGWVR